jgi:hypothetical protein
MFRCNHATLRLAWRAGSERVALHARRAILVAGAVLPPVLLMMPLQHPSEH